MTAVGRLVAAGPTRRRCAVPSQQCAGRFRTKRRCDLRSTWWSWPQLLYTPVFCTHVESLCTQSKTIGCWTFQLVALHARSDKTARANCADFPDPTARLVKYLSSVWPSWRCSVVVPARKVTWTLYSQPKHPNSWSKMSLFNAAPMVSSHHSQPVFQSSNNPFPTVGQSDQIGRIPHCEVKQSLIANHTPLWLAEQNRPFSSGHNNNNNNTTNNNSEAWAQMSVLPNMCVCVCVCVCVRVCVCVWWLIASAQMSILPCRRWGVTDRMGQGSSHTYRQICSALNALPWRNIAEQEQNVRPAEPPTLRHPFSSCVLNAAGYRIETPLFLTDTLEQTNSNWTTTVLSSMSETHLFSETKILFFFHKAFQHFKARFAIWQECDMLNVLQNQNLWCLADIGLSCSVEKAE